MHCKYTNNIQSLNITKICEVCNIFEYKDIINEVWRTNSERVRISPQNGSIKIIH